MTAAIQRGLDDFRSTAVQPVVVGQVREALGAACVRAVALDTVGLEQALAHRLRFRIGRHGFHVHFHELVVQRLVLGFRLGFLFLVLANGSPATDAFPGAQTRVQHQVDGAEDQGDVEHQHPPARQRVVVFLEVVIPDVPHGFYFFPFLYRGLRLAEQQVRQTDDTYDHDYRDVDTPEITHEITHFFAPLAASIPCCSSSSPLKTRLAASS
ncbi:hypothetical protein D3C78_1215910 [compost metagenome]